MLILKKYHDYYDSAVGYGGIDKTCVYNRIPQIEENKYKNSQISELFNGEKIDYSSRPYIKNSSRFNHSKNEPELIMPFIIGFCGKTYVGYTFKWARINKIEIVYGLDNFIALHQFKYPIDKHNKERIEKYFIKYHDKPHSDLFFDYHAPIWIYDFGTTINELNITVNSYFMTNPKLDTFKFYQIKSTPLAFQEIQMYLQGVLGNPEKPTIEISENDKILQHGFDLKWSFRNPCPPNRKQRIVKLNET